MLTSALAGLMIVSLPPTLGQPSVGSISLQGAVDQAKTPAEVEMLAAQPQLFANPAGQTLWAIDARWQKLEWLSALLKLPFKGSLDVHLRTSPAGLEKLAASKDALAAAHGLHLTYVAPYQPPRPACDAAAARGAGPAIRSLLPQLKSVQRMELQCVPFDAALAAALTGPTLVGMLGELAVTSSGVSSELAAALLNVNWTAMTSLDLSFNKIDAKVSRKFRGRMPETLRTLILRGNSLDVESLAPFLDARGSAVQTLDVGLNRLGAGAMRKLLTSRGVVKLRRLDVDCTGLTVADLTTLGGAAGMHLDELQIGEPGLGDAAADAILASPGLRHLRRLTIGVNALTPAKLQVLKDAFGPRLGLVPHASCGAKP